MCIFKTIDIVVNVNYVNSKFSYKPGPVTEDIRTEAGCCCVMPEVCWGIQPDTTFVICMWQFVHWFSTHELVRHEKVKWKTNKQLNSEKQFFKRS